MTRPLSRRRARLALVLSPGLVYVEYHANGPAACYSAFGFLGGVWALGPLSLASVYTQKPASDAT